ncbi:MAG: hypothetical protein JST42_12210 [Bacteroidetes bacterium]|nr:hypothetical protein [Bacteroidota bacterium]
MALSEIFFLAIVLYLLYRFIFNFLLPVVRTTRQVREQFRNMQEGANGDPGAGSGPTSQQQPRQEQKPKQPPVGEYIDFEEVKR